MEVVVLVISIILFTLISGLSSASEIAFFSLSSMRVRGLRRDADPRKRLIADLVLKPRELFVTLFMVNIAVNIFLQNSASKLFGEDASWLLKVGVPLMLALFLGEIIPKYIALQNNLPIAYAMAPIVQKVASALRPLRHLILMITAPVSRTMFFFVKPEDDLSRDEMQHALQSSKESGVLNSEEAKLLQGVLHLQERQVKELMRPREEILFYDVKEPLERLHHLFGEQECTRLPVCDGSIQHVQGILSAHEYFVHRNEIKSPQDLRKFLSKPFYVPETTPAKRLMRQFARRHEVFAVAVDEYGSVVGVITREDLVEVVIGEIADRRDDKPKFTRAGDEVIIASGKLELTEFEEIFGVALHSPNGMVTLGGWLTDAMGDIPKSGTKYQTDMFLFQVLAAEPNRIRRVYVRRLSPGSRYLQKSTGKDGGGK